jgi:hypothetical protein
MKEKKKENYSTQTKIKRTKKHLKRKEKKNTK